MSEAGSGELVVGRIGGPYGINGWVKIHSYTDPMENLFAYRGWRVHRNSGWQSIALEDGRRHGKGLVARIEGVSSRDEAETLKGLDITVAATALPVLATGEYYWHQLEGLAVHSKAAFLGCVDHLLETGANDVLVVKPCEGSMDERERLIPWLVPAVITEVNLEAGTIAVDWDTEF